MSKREGRRQIGRNNFVDKMLFSCDGNDSYQVKEINLGRGERRSAPAKMTEGVFGVTSSTYYTACCGGNR